MEYQVIRYYFSHSQDNVYKWSDMLKAVSVI